MEGGITFPANHNALCQLANQSRLCLSEGGTLKKTKRLREAGHRGRTIMYSRGAQTWSWRAGVLKTLAPTFLNISAGKFLVCLVRARLAGSGEFHWGWS